MPPLPKITPIRLVERAAPFDDPNYLFELKYDGFRAVAYIERGSTKLVSRKGNTYKRFDDLCAGLASAVKVKDAIIDGEIVCLDEAGVPRFDWLLHRRHPPSFVAFDLMWLNGRDYRNEAAVGTEDGAAEDHPDQLAVRVVRGLRHRARRGSVPRGVRA